jgi:ParB-like nuclease domain
MELEVVHGYKVHPAASAFPGMKKRDLKELTEDIKANGLRNPILVTADGLLVDGRNRLRAWKEAGLALKDIPTTTVELDKDDPPSTLTRLVFSHNVARRNLTGAQKVAIRTKLLEEIGEEDHASDDEVAEETGTSTATVRYAKGQIRKGKKEKLAKGDTSGRGRPKGGGPPRRVVLDRGEMTPKELAAFVIKKWNAAPRGYLDNFITQLNEQWKAFEPEEEGNGADE